MSESETLYVKTLSGSLLTHVPFNKPLLRIPTIGLLIQIIVLTLLIYGYWLFRRLIFQRHGNNGLGTGFASYCNICDYDSFSRFGGDSRIHRSARLASYQLSLLSMYLLD